MAYANLYLLLSMLIVSASFVYPTFFYNRLFSNHANWNKLKRDYHFDEVHQDGDQLKPLADKNDDLITPHHLDQNVEESAQYAFKRGKNQEDKKSRPDLRFGKRMNSL